MPKEKLPQLAAILDSDELAHIQAFPSLLRVVIDHSLLEALRQVPDWSKITKLTFNRLIDGAPIELTRSQLIVHLNFHLIHHLDFLPVVDWPTRATDGMFQSFVDMYTLLEERGKLEAKVDLSSCGVGPDGERISLLDVKKWMERGEDRLMKREASCRMTQGFSQMIQHDTRFKIHLANSL
jgi:hypothetical protein